MKHGWRKGLVNQATKGLNKGENMMKDKKNSENPVSETQRSSRKYFYGSVAEIY